MTAWSSGLPQPALVVMLFLALVPILTHAAPLAEQSTEMDSYYPVTDSTGCYYNFQHYDEGDRILTNEPCLNCTCHNRMLMCYLRVCPFTKAIGQDCTVEKRPDQCCPVITCPEVPVQLLPSTTPSTALGHLNEYGCFIDNLFYSDGARVPSNPNSPCELCYCIRNRTACVMQECTLKIEGCSPVYQEGVCCPVKYDCEHPEQNLLETTTTPRPTTGLIFTTTMQPGTAECLYNDELYADGALIKKDMPCEYCYCMKGDIVCAVQECSPTPLDKVNCTAIPARGNQCCPDTYDCDNIIEQELTTLSYDYTTPSPVFSSVRPVESENEEENELSPTLHPSVTDRPSEGELAHTYVPPGLTETPEIGAQSTAQPEFGQTSRPIETEQTQPHTYLPPTTEIPLTRIPDLEGQATGRPDEIPAVTGKPFELEQPKPSAGEGPSATELPEIELEGQGTEAPGAETTGQPEVSPTVPSEGEQTKPYPHIPSVTEGEETEAPGAETTGQPEVSHTVPSEGEQTKPYPHIPSVTEGAGTEAPGAETTGQPEVSPTVPSEGEQTKPYPHIPSVTEGEGTEAPGAETTGQPEVSHTVPSEGEQTKPYPHIPSVTEGKGTEAPGAETTGQPEVSHTVPSEGEQTKPYPHIPLVTESEATEAPGAETTGQPEVSHTVPSEGEQTKPYPHIPSVTEGKGTEAPGAETTGQPEVSHTVPSEGEQTKPYPHIPSVTEGEATEAPGAETTGQPGVSHTVPSEGEQTKPYPHIPSVTEGEGTEAPRAETTGQPEISHTVPSEGEQTKPYPHIPSVTEGAVTEAPGAETTGQPEVSPTVPSEGEQTKPYPHIPSVTEGAGTEAPGAETTGQPEVSHTVPSEGEQTKPYPHIPSVTEGEGTEAPGAETTGQPEVSHTVPSEGEQTKPYPHIPSVTEGEETEAPGAETTGQPEVSHTVPSEGEQTKPYPHTPPVTEGEGTQAPGSETTGQPEVSHTVPSEGEQTKPYPHIPSVTEGEGTEAPGAETTGHPEVSPTVPSEGEQTKPYPHIPSVTEGEGTEVPGVETTGQPAVSPTVPSEGEQTKPYPHIPSVTEGEGTEAPGAETTGQPDVSHTVPSEGEQTKPYPHIPSVTEGEGTEAPEAETTGLPEVSHTVPGEGEQTKPYPYIPSLTEGEGTAAPGAETTGQPEVSHTVPSEGEQTKPYPHIPSVTEGEGTEAPGSETTGQPEVSHTVPSEGEQTKPYPHIPSVTEGEGTEAPGAETTGHPEVSPTVPSEGEQTKPYPHIPSVTEGEGTEVPGVETTGQPEVSPTVPSEGEQSKPYTHLPPVSEGEGTETPGVEVTGQPGGAQTTEQPEPEIEAEATGQPEVTQTATSKPIGESTAPYTHVPGVSEGPLTVTPESEAQVTTSKPSETEATLPHTYLPPTTEILLTGPTEVPDIEAQATGQPEITHPPKEGEHKPATEIPVITGQIPPKEQEPGLHTTAEVPASEQPEEPVTKFPSVTIPEGEHKVTQEIPELTTEGARIPGEGHVPKVEEATELPEGQTELPVVSVTGESHVPETEQATEGIPGEVGLGTEQPSVSVTEGEEYGTLGPAEITETPEVPITEQHTTSEEVTKSPIPPIVTEGIHVPAETEGPAGSVTEIEHATTEELPQGTSYPGQATEKPEKHVTEGEQITGESHVTEEGYPTEGHPPATEAVEAATEGEHVTPEELTKKPEIVTEGEHTPSEAQVTESYPGITKEPISSITEETKIPIEGGAQVTGAPDISTSISEGEGAEGQATEKIPSSTEQPQEGEHVSTEVPSILTTEGERITPAEIPGVTKLPSVEGETPESYPHVTASATSTEGHVTEAVPGLTEEPIPSVTEGEYVSTKEPPSEGVPQVTTVPQEEITEKEHPEVTKEHATETPTLTVTKPGVEVIDRFPEVTKEPTGSVTEEHITTEHEEGEHVPIDGHSTEGFIHVTEEPIVAATTAEHIPVEGHPAEETPEATEGPVVSITQAGHIPSDEQSTSVYPQTLETEQTVPHTYLPPTTEIPSTKIPESATGLPLVPVTEGEGISVEQQKTEMPEEHKPTEVGVTEKLPEQTEKPIEAVTEKEHEGIPVTKEPVIPTEGIPEGTEIPTEKEHEGVPTSKEPASTTETVTITEGEHVPVTVEGITEEPIVAATEGIHVSVEGEPTEETPYVTEKEHVPVEHVPVHVTEEPSVAITEPEKITPATEEHPSATEEPGVPSTETKPPAEVHTEVTAEPEIGHIPVEGEVTEELPHITRKPTEPEVSTEEGLPQTTYKPEVPTSSLGVTEEHPSSVAEGEITEGQPEVTEAPGVSVTEGGHIPEVQLPEGAASTIAPVEHETKTPEGQQVPVQIVTEGEAASTKAPSSEITEQPLPSVTEEGQGYTTTEGQRITYPTEHIPVHVTSEGEPSVTKLPPILQPEGEHIPSFETTKHPETHIPVEVKPGGEEVVTKVPHISVTEEIPVTEGEVSATEQAPVVSSTEGELITGEPELVTEGAHTVLPGSETTKYPTSAETQTAHTTEPSEGEFVPVEVLHGPETPATTRPEEGKEPGEAYSTQEPLPAHEGITEHATEIPDHGVPGEGSCLVDGQTYGNNSSVPPINHCQLSCKCLSSILQCETVTCSPAPSNLHNCMPVYPGPDSCCPTYSCTVPETPEIESDSHKMDGSTTYQTPTEQPITLPISILPPEIEATIKPETEAPFASTGKLPEEHLTEEPIESLATTKPEKVPGVVEEEVTGGLEHVTEYSPEPHITEGGVIEGTTYPAGYPFKPSDVVTGGAVTETSEHTVATEHVPEADVTPGIPAGTEYPTVKPEAPETPVTEGVEHTTGYSGIPSKPTAAGEGHAEEGQTTEQVTGYPNTTPVKTFEYEDHTTLRPTETIPEGEVTGGVEYATGVPEHETGVPGVIEHITGVPSKPAEITTETGVYAESTPGQVSEEIPHEEHVSAPTAHPEYVTETAPPGLVTEGVVHITGTSARPSEPVTEQIETEEKTPQPHVTEGPAVEETRIPELATEQMPEGPATEGIEQVTPSKSPELTTDHGLPEEYTGIPHEEHVPEYTEAVSQPTEQVPEGPATEVGEHITATTPKSTEAVPVGEEHTPEAHITTGTSEKASEIPVTESVAHETVTPQTSETVTEKESHGYSEGLTEEVPSKPSDIVTEPTVPEGQTPGIEHVHEPTEAVAQPTEYPEPATEIVPEGQVTEEPVHITGAPSKPTDFATEPIVHELETQEPHVTESLPHEEHTPEVIEGSTGKPEGPTTESIEHATAVPSQSTEFVTESKIPEQQTTVSHAIDTTPHEHVPEHTEGVPQATEHPEVITEHSSEGVVPESGVTEIVTEVVTKLPSEGQVTEGIEQVTGSTSKPSELITEHEIPAEHTPADHTTEKLPHEEPEVPEMTEGPSQTTVQPQVVTKQPSEGQISEATESGIPQEQTPLSHVTEKIPDLEHVPEATEQPQYVTEHTSEGVEHITGTVTESIEHGTGYPSQPSESITEGAPHKEGEQTTDEVTGYPNTTPAKSFEHEDHTTLRPYVPVTAGEVTTGAEGLPEHETELPEHETKLPEGVEHVTGIPSKPTDIVTEPVIHTESTPGQVDEGVPHEEHVSAATEHPEYVTETSSTGVVTEGVVHITGTSLKPSDYVTESITEEGHVPEVTEGPSETTGKPEVITEQASEGPITEGVDHVTGAPEHTLPEEHTTAGHVTEGIPHEEHVPDHTEVEAQPTEHPELVTEQTPEGEVTEGIVHVTGSSSTSSELVTEAVVHEEETPAAHVTGATEKAPESPVTEGVEEETGTPSKPYEQVTPEGETEISATEGVPPKEHVPGYTEGISQPTEQATEEQVTEGGVHTIPTEQTGLVTEHGAPKDQTTQAPEGHVEVTKHPEIVTEHPTEGQITEEIDHAPGTTIKPSELTTEQEQTSVAHVTVSLPEEHVPEQTEVPSKASEQPEITTGQPLEGPVTEGIEHEVSEGQTPVSHVTEELPHEEHIPEATGQPEYATEPAPEGVEHVTSTVTEGVEHETSYPSKPSESVTEGVPQKEGEQTTEQVTGYPNTTPVHSFEYEDHTTSKPSEGEVTVGVEYATGVPEHETGEPGTIEHVTGIPSKPSEIATEPVVEEEGVTPKDGQHTTRHPLQPEEGLSTFEGHVTEGPEQVPGVSTELPGKEPIEEETLKPELPGAETSSPTSIPKEETTEETVYPSVGQEAINETGGLTTSSTQYPHVTEPVAESSSSAPDFAEQTPEIPDYHLPPEEEYEEEEQGAFGPGTCRYGGKVYVSAQQIPRDDPCDFCFCFRSDIICLQQSCPPPIPRCHEEPIRGFCCPRYECPVSMATSVNITTTTTTTTTTLPPHFFSHAYKGRATRQGCQIQGQAYQVGEEVPSASGPCLQCKCGGNGQMKCDPKACSPEPMLRKMIAEVASRRRR